MNSLHRRLQFPAYLLIFLLLPAAAFASKKEKEFGVLRAWLANSPQDNHTAGPNDVIYVEVKSLDGWVSRQVEIRGYFPDPAIDSASDDLKRIIRSHGFELATAASDQMENAVEGDTKGLQSIVTKDEFNAYAKALLTAEGKWKDNQDPKVTLQLASGRRLPEQVVVALFGTKVFAELRDLLPQNDQKQPDIAKTVKVLQDTRDCGRKLGRTAREHLHPKINDLVFDNIAPLNPDSALPTEDRKKSDPMASYEWFRFRLVEDSKSLDSWNELRQSGLYQHDVTFTLVTTLGDLVIALPTTIQRNTGTQPPPDADRFFLQIASPVFSAVAWAVFIIILVILFALSIRTDIVSDTSGIRRADGIRPYSLARAQMAFWFLVIIWASLFLWIATGSWHILNDTCLWLIGIGSGTALGSALIAASPKAAEESSYLLTRRRGESVENFRTELDQEIQKCSKAAAGETQEQTDARTKRSQALQKQKEDLDRMPQTKVQRLFHDWLTDGDTYSFHRYQMFAWTVVLGVFFIIRVTSKWDLPTFDGITLALLGITSGTYLGFKLQQTQ